MKNLIVLLAALLLSSLLYAQTLRDVVTLKNGSIIYGTITEQTPPTQLKIKTADGSIFVFKYDEIEKITREDPPAAKKETAMKQPTPELNEFGGPFSLGIALGGGGLVGVPIRLALSRKFAFEVGFFAQPSYVRIRKEYYDPPYHHYYETEDKFSVPLFVSAGFDVFFSEKFVPEKNKVCKNGMMFKFGKTMTDDFEQNMYSIGWAYESIKATRKKSAFVSELGIGVWQFDYINPLYDELGITDVNVMPFVYWKLNWNWYLGSYKK